MVLFVANGYSLLTYIGIQQDEALFTGPLFPNGYSWFSIQVLKRKIPLMLMSYLGCAKTWLYAGIFHLWDPTVYSLRLPVLLLGATTLPLFFALVRRASGYRTACLGVALLAADSCYLLTAVVDWGPVVIQHVTLLAGMWGVLTAVQTARTWPLAIGSFAFGFGLWDKALLIWLLSGVGLATVVLFFQEVKRFLTLRRFIASGFFFLLGALPLVIYNVRRPLDTFRGNTSFSTENLAQKVHLMRATLKGSALLGVLAEED